MNKMIELPRNPVDEKIDRLSVSARRCMMGLYERGALNGKTESLHAGSAMASFVVELQRNGLVISGKTKPDGYFTVTLSFDGWFGAEKVACGLYDHHKQIEEFRQNRDATNEAHPLWATF